MLRRIWNARLNGLTAVPLTIAPCVAILLITGLGNRLFELLSAAAIVLAWVVLARRMAANARRRRERR